MSETGEAPLITLTREQRAQLRNDAKFVVMTEHTHGLTGRGVERVRLAREAVKTANFDAGLQEIVESPSDIVARARERLGEVGTTRNPTTHAREFSTEEKARHRRAETALTLVGDFVEKGYEGIKPDQQRALVDKLRSIFINHHVLGKGFSTDRAVQDKEIIAWIQDPLYAKVVATQLEKVNEIMFTNLSDIHAAAANRAESIGRENVTQDAEKRFRQAAERTRRSLRDLQDPNAAQNLPQNRTQRLLQDARDTRDEAQTEFNTAQADYTQVLQDHLAAGGTHRTALQDPTVMQAYNAVNAVRTTRDNANREFQVAQRHAYQQEQEQELEVREGELENRLEQQYERRDQARLAAARSPEEAAAARAAEQDLLSKRANEEALFARHLDNALGVAMRKSIADKLTQAVQTLEEVEPELLSEEIKDARKDVQDQMNKIFTTSVPRSRGLFKRPIMEQVRDQQKIDEHFTRLLADGPKDDIRTILAAKGYTPDTINELMDNDNFTDIIKPFYSKNVIAQRMLTRGIRPAEADLILKSSWGKDMIQQALEVNNEYRKVVQDLTDTEDIDMDKPEFRNRLAREVGNRPWLLLTIFPFLKAAWQAQTYDKRQTLTEQIAA
ncbi:MAG: hypothetical protein ACR2LN_04030 [Candidatus Levyibacteriota bacterium]